MVEEDINVKFLVQLDKLIRLLETPIFAYLRLQVRKLKIEVLFFFLFGNENRTSLTIWSYYCLVHV